ncbi:MAG: HlyD family efflux transporter periplasmic adaptor subunit [Alphaproteobacteria bacterium]|nr:HlyD family efflux transporter periplasmic adaptor subunit [Alphaproteobacteria bacterium]
MKRIVAIVAVVVVVLVTLLGLKVYAQRAALDGPAGGSGVVEGTSVRVASRVGGRIVAQPVREGQQVHAGDVLAELDCIEPKAGLDEARARVQAAQEQASAAHRAADAAGQAVVAAEAGARAAAAQARAATAQRDAAERQAGRLAAASSDVSAAMQDQARAQADGLHAQTDAVQAQAQAGSAQARAAGQQAAAAGSQADAADQAAAAAQAALARAEVAVAECTVTAPVDATVRLLPFEVGELVGPGTPLVTLVDLSVVQAAFYLPNADLAAARAGGRATVSADAWPDRVFEGTVSTVATEPEFTPRNIQTRTDRDRLVYRVEVDVPNPDGALRPGMPVEVELAAGDAP